LDGHLDYIERQRSLVKVPCLQEHASCLLLPEILQDVTVLGFFVCLFLFLAILRFELRAWCLIGPLYHLSHSTSPRWF
jgi:hypothetical protein